MYLCFYILDKLNETDGNGTCINVEGLSIMLILKRSIQKPSDPNCLSRLRLGSECKFPTFLSAFS
jgi:hypothetical protein